MHRTRETIHAAATAADGGDHRLLSRPPAPATRTPHRRRRRLRPTRQLRRRYPPPRPSCDAPDLYTELVRAANTLRTHLHRAVLHQRRLNWTSFDVLQLVRAGGVATTAAARSLGIAKATLSDAVDTLQRRGLVRRRTQLRWVFIETTPAGAALTDTIVGMLSAHQAELSRRSRLEDPFSVANALARMTAQLQGPRRSNAAAGPRNRQPRPTLPTRSNR